ncbi:hypothetical protein [Hymenobacter psychrotolerans]|uniref:hypothetical protein n=1 Tax=Hymenobacter psychrotolerans TaxID=344998 RepID=UPI001114EEF8|nr:hypothetical protein [Hymenobacter psychrotolerans]
MTALMDSEAKAGVTAMREWFSKRFEQMNEVLVQHPHIISGNSEVVDELDNDEPLLAPSPGQQ